MNGQRKSRIILKFLLFRMWFDIINTNYSNELEF